MKIDKLTNFSQIMDLVLDAICVVDTEGRFVFVNAACKRIFGYTPEEMIGKKMIDMVHPEDREKTLHAAAEIMSGDHKPHFENRYLHKNGSVVHVMWSARWSEPDHLRIAVARDITAHKRAEAIQTALYSISEAAQLSDNLTILLEQTHQIIAELIPASNLFFAFYNKQKDELSYPYHVDQQHQTPPPARLDSDPEVANIIRSGQPLLRIHKSSAQTNKSLSWLGVPIISHQGTTGALVVQSYTADVQHTEADKDTLLLLANSIATAIEHKQKQARLLYTAQYDPLTDLPNRELLADRLKTGLARAHCEQEKLAVLYLDLDKFKQVNDNYGHAAGDLLLQMVAQRLRQCLRKIDTIARVGGDEFVILLEKVNSEDDIRLVAEKVCTALSQPFDLSGPMVWVLPSIGVAQYPAHGDEADQLLRHADAAMYLAKRKGGNQFQMH